MGKGETEAGLQKKGYRVKYIRSKSQPRIQTEDKSTNIRVNPESKLTAKDFHSLLTKSTALPKNLREALRFDEKEGLLWIFPSSKQSLDKEPEWIRDLKSVRNDWEITTGTLVLHIEEGAVKYQKIESDVGSEEGRVIRSDNPSYKIGVEVDFLGIDEGTLGGKTTANYSMGDKEPSKDVAILDSGRGLITIVTSVVVEKLEKKGEEEVHIRTKPIEVPKTLQAKNLIHELSAHAGRFSQKKPAAHDHTEVDKNTKVIEEIFMKSTTKIQDEYTEAILRDIAAMLRGNIKEDSD